MKIPFRCTTCKRELVLDIDRRAQARMRAGAVEKCGCSYPMEPAMTAEAMKAAFSVPMTDPPSVVSAYLREAGAAPEPTQERILGKYEIVRKIGRGGEGEIFLARQIGPAEFEKEVVIKRIHRHRLAQHVLVEDFIREARIAARLSHRNIVQIVDFGRVADEYIIAMEYVDGIDLAEAFRISRFLKQSWPVELCCRIVSDLCAGLQAAHGLGVIHRDVSPSNVLIATDGTVKLTDFGVAKSRENTGDTPTGIFKGKEAYAPPEQLFGNRKTDSRGDLFAAGVLLYEALTLRWFSDNYSRFLKGATVPQVVAEIRRDLPPAVRAILLRSLALEPEDRYATASELQADLESVLKQGRYASSSDLAAWIEDLVEIKRRGGRGRKPKGAKPIGGETQRVESPPPIEAVEVTERRPQVEPAGSRGDKKSD